MMKKNNENTEWHIQDVSQNPELIVSAAKHMPEKDTSKKGISSQCKEGTESDGGLQPEWSKTASDLSDDVSDLSDDVSGREQGAENRDTETERSKAAWDMRNDVSADVLGREQKAKNGGTGAEQVFMKKIDNKNTDANHVLEKETNQRKINSQCKDEKGRDGELHSDKSKAARDMRNDSPDDVPDAKQVPEKDMGQREIESHCKDEKRKDGDLHPERNKVSRYLRNDSSDDVPGGEHGAENGYTEPESLLEKDTENTNAKQLLEDTYQREINSQCKDEKERDGELHQEKSKTARDMRNDSFDDVLGRKHGVENGYTEPESPMDKDTENTNAKEVLKEDTTQREINSQCKDGEIHQERSKPVRDLRNDSSDDVLVGEHGAEKNSPMKKDTENTKWHTGDTLRKSKLEASAATQILEMDTSLSKIGGQCEDKNKSDRESGSERSEAAVEPRTDLTDDVFGSEQGAKNDFFDVRFLIKETEINREHTIQVGICNLESEIEVHKYLRRKDGSVVENKWQDVDRESGDTSCKKANDKHISSIDDWRRIANFRHERHVDGMNRKDKLPKEYGINGRYDTDRYSGEASSSNHTNNMHHKRYMMENVLTKNQYKKSKQTDSDQRMKSTCKSRMFSNQSEDYRDLRSQRKKQTLGDVEKSAFYSSKLHSYADRNRSENRHSKKVDSVVVDNLSKISPLPIFTRSRSRNCIGCRSREEESAQREPLSHDKSCASAASTKDHGSTSEIRKINSAKQHSNKFDYCVGENRSKNSPCSQVSKDPSRFKLNEGGSTRKEGSLSRGNLGVKAYSRVDHSSALGVRKRDSKQGYSEKDDPSTSHILKGPSRCQLSQGNSTERESLSNGKSRPSVAPTADNCSTPRVGKREPQYRHSEKADFSVCNNQSKNSSCSSVKYESGLKQGNSTRKEPSSYGKFCSSVASTVDHCSTPGVGKRDPEYQHLEKVDFSVCDNQSKKASISLVNKYQSGRRSKDGNSTSSSQAIDLKNRRARESDASIHPSS